VKRNEEPAAISNVLLGNTQNCSMEISVIICCYNSESRIVPTLEHLQKQEVSAGLDWEAILVDNNCADRTVDAARQTWRREDVELRVASEPAPGLSAARDRGLRQAKGTFVLFCDDDNWLAPDYLDRGYQYLLEHPDYAAVGGWGEATSDQPLPDWFEAVQTRYACGVTRRSGDAKSLIGAGLFLRKKALEDLVASGFKSTLSDRKGEALSSGGDIELTLALRLRGWKLSFSEEMTFKHYMPEQRLTKDYFLKMCHGHGRSRPVLSEYRRLLEGGWLARATLWLLPGRVFFRVVKNRSFRRPQPCHGDLEWAGWAAANAGALEAECQLIRSFEVWGLARRIKQNGLP